MNYNLEKGPLWVLLTPPLPALDTEVCIFYRAAIKLDRKGKTLESQ